MKGYIAKRVAIALITLWAVMTINFLIFRVFAPVKDPTDLILNPDMRPEDIERLKDLWGIGRGVPLFPDQYLKYLYNLFTWQYGVSFGTTELTNPIAPEMVWRLRNTLILLGTALVVTVALGVPTGILAGSHRGSKRDVTVLGIGLFTWGLPTFFIQMLFILFFAYWWTYNMGWTLLPGTGVVSSPAPPPGTLAYVADMLWHAILPITTLSIASFGSWALYTRNMIVETLTEDYIVTAQAKGVKERDILYKHAFRSILPPIATLLALSIPGIVTGALITEYIFNWPGIGQWYIHSVVNGNHPVAQAVMYNYAVLMIGANLVADFLYGILDPRIRVGARR